MFSDRRENQLFVSYMLSRGEIAELFNDALERYQDEEGEALVEQFKSDDPRLDDSICQAAANVVGRLIEEPLDEEAWLSERREQLINIIKHNFIGEEEE